MKRIWIAGAFALLVGGPAFAADLPPPVAPPPRAPATYVPVAVPYYNWGGIYIGVNGGGEFGTFTPPGAIGTSFNTTGFVVGPTVGFNFQAGSFVFGVEGDWDYSTINGTTPGGGGTFKDNWLATVRGRAGYAWDRVLFFATAGGAFENAQIPGSSTTPIGWTAGAGIEYAFAQNWTAKAEYLFVDFPTVTLTAGGASFSSKETENIVRAGVNYKFNF
jgi:outer membrane immunogenic protein